MEPGQPAQLNDILGQLTIGIAILDCANFRVLYANPYLQSLCEEPWRSRGINGQHLEAFLPPDMLRVIEPVLRDVCEHRQKVSYDDLPYEGFLETRGRTYWQVSIEFKRNLLAGQAVESQASRDALVVTIEDVTDKVRSRMHINAIHYISSAIVGRFALPQVLDRILQSVSELVGSTRCAILLLENSISGGELRSRKGFNNEREHKVPPRVSIAAQKGLHSMSLSWRPELSERLLLGKVMKTRSSLIISDTNAFPDAELPMLDDHGIPRRPGSVLSVPIFEPPLDKYSTEAVFGDQVEQAEGGILGTIEVYHRRVRGLPAEEVALLEQFAQQVGLAIQNARFFLRIDSLAQDARRQARQRENVMQAIPDGVIIYDARWRIADTNSAIRKLLGWKEDVVGLHINEALARSSAKFLDSSPSVHQLVQELELKPEEAHIDEFKLIGADGLYYTIRRSKAPIADEEGNIFAYVVVYHDITEQAMAREQVEAQVIARTAELNQRNQALQQAQAALELEHARLEVLLSRLPSGILLVSAYDRHVTLSNRQAAQVLFRMGWELNDVTIDDLDDLDAAAERIKGLDIEAFLQQSVIYGSSGAVIPYKEQPLYKALYKGEASEAELHIVQPDEQEFYLLVNAAPLRAADGTITDVVLVLQDITRIKSLERTREDFFTTMAHELKTPLANIRAHLTALQAQDMEWSPENQREFLQTADEQVERLVGMINHFLDASRVEAGALRLELEPILLPEMFEDLQERLEALIASSKRRLEICQSDDLPTVEADYELIMSVLTNLLSNAFRYAPEGDAVFLNAETIYNTAGQPDAVELSVTDRGEGISPERQTELFTRFSTFAAMRRPAADRPGQPAGQRERANERWSAATGLGLYISRGIVEAHGGKLHLKSKPGEGTTFSFTLRAASSPHETED
jgi:PAS domain S-box-containing protein